MAQLVIEIGTEEIPAGYIPPALEAMAAGLCGWLAKNRVDHGPARTFGTPRRLAVAVDGVDTQQPDWEEVALGPSVNIAFDKEGQPTKAAEGFARGKGVAVADLFTTETPKGAVVSAKIEQAGRPVAELLNGWLPEFIAAVPFPKKMRWGDSKRHPQPFVRPIHWIAAVFDGQPLDFEIDGVHSGNTSYGHRFLKPDAFTFCDLPQYLEQCQAHSVMVDIEERCRRIEQQAAVLAGEVGGSIKPDVELLHTVTHLVETPVTLLGEIDKKYLKLPVELLEITMKHHQKYFPVWKNENELLPFFITVSNMPADGSGDIVRGNQRVLKARLEDARFFFEEDQKRPLEDYVENLKGVVFQKDLGTLYEKVERMVGLLDRFAGWLDDKQNKNSPIAKRAARLCKADLTTQMVFEFPELQGVIGGYYAKKDEGEAVAQAIKEHYKPAFAGDSVPSTLEGALVALADKLDTIVGCIAVGLIPTGSEDPYALRRHASGIIQILLEYDLTITFNALFQVCFELISDKQKVSDIKLGAGVDGLFMTRLQTLLESQGIDYDVIDAVLFAKFEYYPCKDVFLKAQALSDLKRQDYFEELAIAFRRVVNILEGQTFPEPQPERFQEPAEKALWEKYLYIRKPVEEHISVRDYNTALARIVEIKPEVDAFFDQVMVNVEDAGVRDNRKALLSAIAGLFSKIADFSKIVVKKS